MKCIFKNYLRLLYNRDTDKIILKPCCVLEPIEEKPPYAYEADYFIDNFEECIFRWETLDIHQLSKYYKGPCTLSSHSFDYLGICDDYVDNRLMVSLDISISRACNLNCIMCNERRDFNERERDVYLRLIDKVCKWNRTITVSTTGVGEPFLYKDTIYKILKNSNHMLGIITNATLITDEDIKFLSNYRHRVKIIVSCDSFKKDTYEKIRRGASFDTVIHNIMALKNHELLQQINYVVQQENIEEIKSIYDFLCKDGFKLELIVKDDDFFIKNQVRDLLKNNILYKDK